MPYEKGILVGGTRGLHRFVQTSQIAGEKSTKEIAKEIAEELFISPRTVETHRTNIGRKLDLHGPLGVLKFAVANKSQL